MRPLPPQPAHAQGPTPPHAPPAAVASATEQPATESAAPSLLPPTLPPPSQPAGEQQGHGTDQRQHQRTLEVLQDVLRCCHDPEAWKKEEAALLQLGGSLEGTQQYADHLDKVLTDRADMFLKMRDGLRVMKEKARATADPKPNCGEAAVLLD